MYSVCMPEHNTAYCVLHRRIIVIQWLVSHKERIAGEAIRDR